MMRCVLDTNLIYKVKITMQTKECYKELLKELMNAASDLVYEEIEKEKIIINKRLTDLKDGKKVKL